MSATSQNSSDSTDSEQFPDRQEAQPVLPVSLQMAEEQFEADPDNDNSPNMTVVGDGRAVNRVIIVGTLMNIEPIGSGDALQATIFAGNNEVRVTAGQYSPSAQSFLREMQGETPEYVSVTAKISLNQQDDITYVNLDPENMSVVGDTDDDSPNAADQWVAEAAIATMEAVTETQEALEGDVDSRRLDVWQDCFSDEDLETITDEAEEILEDRF